MIAIRGNYKQKVIFKRYFFPNLLHFSLITGKKNIMLVRTPVFLFLLVSPRSFSSFFLFFFPILN